MLRERKLLLFPLLWRIQKAHIALIDALMSLAARETVGRVKMAVEAEQMGVGAPWENALLFWVNRVRPKPHDQAQFNGGSAQSLYCSNTTMDYIAVQVLYSQLYLSKSRKLKSAILRHLIAFFGGPF